MRKHSVFSSLQHHQWRSVTDCLATRRYDIVHDRFLVGICLGMLAVKSAAYSTVRRCVTYCFMLCHAMLCDLQSHLEGNADSEWWLWVARQVAWRLRAMVDMGWGQQQWGTHIIYRTGIHVLSIKLQVARTRERNHSMSVRLGCIVLHMSFS